MYFFKIERPVTAQSSATTGIEGRLLEKIAQQPHVASNWRLLGRLRLRRGDVRGAIDAGWHAVNLAPRNASAQFDLGNAWLAAEDLQKASYHFQLTRSLAPESDYAQQATFHLAEIERRRAAPQPAPLRSELEPNRFGGTPIADSETGGEPFIFELEFGGLYNSNVQLAPISRVVGAPGLASFQGFIAPHFEWNCWKNSDWTSGVSFDGYFNVNESNFSAFDLQDYQPGAFVERTFLRGESEWIGRIQYDFTFDQFAGQTYGQRHGLTTLLNIIRDQSESTIYWTVDHSDFASDGATPAITSQDGWTNTLGASHTLYSDDLFWDQLRAGIDLQWAPLTGQDFAYRGVYLYGGAEFLLWCDLVLALQAGWGYRDYPDFTGSPSRNENLWRGGVELRREFGEHWEIAALVTFDRFASDNAQYDTDRYITGVTTTFRR